MLDNDFSHEIRLRAPFDLALTTAVARRLPSNILYPLHDGELRVVMSLDNEATLIAARQTSPQTVVYRALGAALSDGRQATVEANLRRLLGLDVDLAPLNTLLAREPVIGPLARRLSGLRPPRFLSLWETFVQVIPFQQVSLAAAMTMLNRMVMAYGPRVRFEGEEYRGAPPPDRMLSGAEAEMRACGLSAAKVMALRGCAEWLMAGKISEDELAGLSDEEAAQRLRALPGIGPWSAQLVLLRGFGRLGNFPAGDSGAAKGMREVFEAASNPEAAAAEALERLGEWRGYLYFMLLGRRILGLG